MAGVRIVIVAIIAYLLGSINVAIILSKTIYKEDIREKGSGNAGLTNTLRNYGKKVAFFNLIGDVLKGVLSIILAWVIVPEEAQLLAACIAAAACVLGHNFPLYFRFKGGKGVLTTLAVMLMIAPIPAVIALIVFIVVVLLTKYVSLGSMVAALTLTILTLIRGNYFSVSGGLTPLSVLAIGLATLIIIRHHANISRLIKGTENKLSLKKKKAEEEKQ